MQADALCSLGPKWRSVASSLPHLWCNITLLVDPYSFYPPSSILERWLTLSGTELPLSIVVCKEKAQPHVQFSQLGCFQQVLAILLRHVHRWESLEVGLEGYAYLAGAFEGVSLSRAVNLRTVAVSFTAEAEYFTMVSIATVPNLKRLTWYAAPSTRPEHPSGHDNVPSLFPCHRLTKISLTWCRRPWEQVAQIFLRCQSAVVAHLHSQIGIWNTAAFPARTTLYDLQALHISMNHLDGMAILSRLRSPNLSLLTIHIGVFDSTPPKVTNPFDRLIDFIAHTRHRIQLFRLTLGFLEIPQTSLVRLLVECRKARMASVGISLFRSNLGPEDFDTRRDNSRALDEVDSDLKGNTAAPLRFYEPGEADYADVTMGWFDQQASTAFFNSATIIPDLDLSRFPHLSRSGWNFHQLLRR